MATVTKASVAFLVISCREKNSCDNFLDLILIKVSYDIFLGSYFDKSEQKMVAERSARKVGQFWERVKGSKFLINFFGRQFNPATVFFGQIHFAVWTNIRLTISF